MISKYEKRTKNFLYTSSFFTICTGSINLIHGDIANGGNLVMIGSGLYGIANSITDTKKTIKKCQFYQTSSIIGSLGSSSALILSNDPICTTINSFLIGNFLLFSYVFYHEKKNLTKSYYFKK